ncbi:MAG: amidohydrolase family protein [Proteobacteria bacterium]|nr:amidohydrolase family protein [Pseudomonadota bacterium]
MIIDMHIHPFCKEATVTPSLEEAVRRMTAPARDRVRAEAGAAMLTALFTSHGVQDIIAAMDAAGVAKAVIVAMDLSSHYGVRMVTNQDLARLTAAHPDRFIPFAGVDPGLGRPALDMFADAVENLGCRGMKLVPPVQHFDISDPVHNPLWEAALDLDVPVWTHAAHQRSHPDSDARLGHPMLVEAVALRYPDLKIVLGHCGFPWPWETWSLVVRHANVFMDVSAYPDLYNHLPWDAYVKYQAEDKVLFATDYPLFGFQQTLDALDQVGLTDEFKRKILGENARRLLKIEGVEA